MQCSTSIFFHNSRFFLYSNCFAHFFRAILGVHLLPKGNQRYKGPNGTMSFSGALSPSTPKRARMASSSKQFLLIDLNDDCLMAVFRQFSLLDILVKSVYKYHSSVTNFNVNKMVMHYRNGDRSDFSHSVLCTPKFISRDLDTYSKMSISIISLPVLSHTHGDF